MKAWSLDTQRYFAFTWQVLVAVHRIVLFGVNMEDDRMVDEAREAARMNLSVLRLGVHRFLAMGVNRCGAAIPTTTKRRRRRVTGIRKKSTTPLTIHSLSITF